MLNRTICLGLVMCSLSGLQAATPPLKEASMVAVQLKDKAAVVGRILADKKDQLVIDLGYTVLAIPKKEIVKISNQSGFSPADTGAKATESKPQTVSQKGPVAPKVVAPTTRVPSFYTVALTPPPEKSVRELVNELGEAVVQVRTPGGLGSGFIINEDGYLITNFHVIEGETQISVEVYHQKGGQLDRRSYKQVKIMAINKFADLALLKIDDKETLKFSRVSLGDADNLSVGERVFAIGSPLGLERTVTEGIVSTKTRPFQGDLYLQTTAQINPGNSGGPLFNLRGEVVGVTNMKISFGEGLGFAIPIEGVKGFLNHRDAYAYDNDNPSNAYRYLPPPSRAQHVTSNATSAGK